MKIKPWLLGLIVFFLTTSCMAIAFLHLNGAQEKDKVEIGEFSLNIARVEDKWEFETFASDKNVGNVSTAKVAIQKAKELLAAEFRIDCDDEFLNGKWIKADYDPVNHCWHIYNTTPRNMVGGVVHVYVQENGDVLAAWIED